MSGHQPKYKNSLKSGLNPTEDPLLSLDFTANSQSYRSFHKWAEVTLSTTVSLDLGSKDTLQVLCLFLIKRTKRWRWFFRLEETHSYALDSVNH